MTMHIERQPQLFHQDRLRTRNDSTSGSFVSNMSLPIHRWFRYSSGFDAEWVVSVIATESLRSQIRVFDPFVGSGTTLICAEQCNVPAYGIDSHPFIARVAQAKLAYRGAPETFLERSREVLLRARSQRPNLQRYAPLIRRCFTDDALAELDCLRQAIEEDECETETSKLVWLALVAILRKTSYVGTATWQYILPNRRKSRPSLPYVAFNDMAETMYCDMLTADQVSGPRAVFNTDDARFCSTLADDSVNLVVTSPPYPNNYDYADSTRLELTFLGEIVSWKDLQTSVRRHLLRSCTQHVPNRAVNLSEILASTELDPIRPELTSVCEQLYDVRKTRGGKKNYHNMIGCYFLDLARVWIALRRVCETPSTLCFVIGDSAPYGVYVPAMDWLGELAKAAGFRSYTFEKIRDRNTKWANRKHRVPLCEGRLWVEG